jgi:hypothetical protein
VDAHPPATPRARPAPRRRARLDAAFAGAVARPWRGLDVVVRRVGEDANPVLVMDDVLENLDEVRDAAMRVPWVRGRRGRYYPGYTSEVSIAGLPELARRVGEHAATEVYGLPARPASEPRRRWRVQSFFAAFAPDPAARHANVHVDGFSWLAVLVHLARPSGPRTGTGFWRHRPTGLESFFFVDERNEADVRRTEALFGLDGFARRRATRGPDGLLSALAPSFDAVPLPFPAADHGDWELIDFVEAKPNRLVAYPTWRWHGVVHPDYAPPARLADARLTLNAFVDHPDFPTSPEVPVVDLEGLVE